MVFSRQTQEKTSLGCRRAQDQLDCEYGKGKVKSMLRIRGGNRDDTSLALREGSLVDNETSPARRRELAEYR